MLNANAILFTIGSANRAHENRAKGNQGLQLRAQDETVPQLELINTGIDRLVKPVTKP